MTTQAPSTAPTDVYLELGTKRVFACALEWPGWCRGGRDEQRPEERRAPGRRTRGGGRLFTGGGTRAEWRRRGHD